MAFPTIATIGQSSESTNTTTHDVVKPTGISAGDLLIWISNTDGAPTITAISESGWTNIFSVAGGSAPRHVAYYKFAGASELDFTYTTSASEKSVNYCIRITGAHGSTAPEGSATTETTEFPDPPSVNPTGWDVEDTLWIVSGGIDDASVLVDAYPYASNNNQASATNPGGTRCAWCTNNSASASLDPGTWDLSASTAAAAGTIAVRPAGATPGNPWYAYAQQ